MHFEGNYILWSTVDIVRMADAVAGLSEEDWLEDRYRQDTFAPHRDTHTVPLLFDADFRHTGPSQCKNYQRFSPVLEPVRSLLAHCFGPGGWLIRALFARLPPGGAIPSHSDRGFSLTHSHRLHLPVVTNEAAGFSVGGEERQMRCGELWEINNTRRHAAWNHGSGARIHLICDWVSGPGGLLEAG